MAPTEGAGLANVTVPPFGLSPPVTAAEEMLTLDKFAGLIAKSVLSVVPFCTALIVTDWDVATGEEDTVNVAELAPAGIETVAGTVANVVSRLDRLTTVPPAGAMPSSNTVPVDVSPPTTADGLNDRVVIVGVRTSSEAVAFTFPDVAVMMTLVLVVTGMVLMTKSAASEPGVTMTNGGTITDGSLLSKVTTSPPAGALVAKVTVPVELCPPETESGLTDRSDASMVLTSVPTAKRLPTDPAEPVNPQDPKYTTPAGPIAGLDRPLSGHLYFQATDPLGRIAKRSP